jgi:hypothetical protein
MGGDARDGCLNKAPLAFKSRLQVTCMALVVSAMLPSPQLPAQGKGSPVEHPSFYRTITIDGLSIFYREAGPNNVPTLLLLHGFPSSSRWWVHVRFCSTHCEALYELERYDVNARRWRTKPV